MVTEWDGVRLSSLRRSLDRLASAGVELAIISVNDARSVARLSKVVSSG